MTVIPIPKCPGCGGPMARRNMQGFLLCLDLTGCGHTMSPESYMWYCHAVLVGVELAQEHMALDDTRLSNLIKCIEKEISQ